MTDGVIYEGRIPAELRTYADKHADQVSHVGYTGGWATASGMAYDAMLCYGWKVDGAHLLSEDTARAMVNTLRRAEPCTCAECASGEVRERR